MTNSTWGARARHTARRHLPFIALVAVYIGIAAIAVRMVGHPESVTLIMYSSTVYTMTGVFLATFVVLHPLWVILVVRPASPFRFIAEHWKTRLLTPERIVGATIVLVLLPSFVSVFSGIKMTIPAFQPFSWDPFFELWDRRLHLGRHPWEWLQPVLGRPLVTSTISVLYQLWFFVTFSILLWQAFSTARPRLRMQFLLAFVLVWGLLGNLLAAVLSSAGPVYFGRVTDMVDPYAPLLSYLQTANESFKVFVLTSQDLLWSTYSADSETLGGGISAMPSMHVGSTFLSALVAWRTNRTFGIILAIYTVIIVVGSVHLAWHYALDGYVSIPIALLLWWLAGKWAARVVPEPDRTPPGPSVRPSFTDQDAAPDHATA